MDNSKYLLPREYEMLAILLPDQGEEETKAAIDKVLSYITDENGTVDSVSADSPWGRRRLAYEIQKKPEGIYVVLNVTAEPAVVKELDRQYSLNEQIMRTKVIRPDLHL